MNTLRSSSMTSLGVTESVINLGCEPRRICRLVSRRRKIPSAETSQRLISVTSLLSTNQNLAQKNRELKHACVRVKKWRIVCRPCLQMFVRNWELGSSISNRKRPLDVSYSMKRTCLFTHRIFQTLPVRSVFSAWTWAKQSDRSFTVDQPHERSSESIFATLGIITEEGAGKWPYASPGLWVQNQSRATITKS